MGNSISISNSVPNIDPDDLHIIGKTSFIRWGEVFEMENGKTNQKVLMQERFTQDTDIYLKYLEQSNKRLSLVHDNLACLLGFSQSDAPDPTTNRFSICLYFEHVATSLADLIDARAAALNSAQSRTPKKANLRQYYFDESELLRFLNQLIDVLAVLQVSGINLGDITPDVCFVTETGNIKIIDKKFIFDDRTTFDLISEGVTHVLATPGELKALENGFNRCSENRYKADLFRVGMILVECATLQSSYDVYDWRSQTINIEALSSRLIDIKARYSENFYNLVREMLRFDEAKRPDFVTLNQRIQDESDVKLNSMLSKSESLKSSQVKARPTVEAPLSSKGNEKSPSNKSPHQGMNVTKTLRDQYMQSVEKERERERKLDKRARKEDDADDTHEFEADMKVNTIRLTQPRLSIGSSHHADTSYEMLPNSTNLSKSTLPNFERVSYQEVSRKTTPNSSKKETPIKPSPESLRREASMRTTPSKLRIFDPIKSPQPLQNFGILSPVSKIHEQPRQTTPAKPSEEYAGKMYSPFNHRPSRSDITSSPTAKQQINYENLSNFPQLGRYTSGYNTPSAEKPIVFPENRSANKTNPSTSPGQFTAIARQPSPNSIKGNLIQFSEPSVNMTVPDSYRSMAPQPNLFSTTQTPVHNERHIEEQSPQWGYSSSLPQSFGNLEGGYNASFSNTQPVQQVGFKEDNRRPSGYNVPKEESPRMSFARSALPKFGGQTPTIVEEVSPAFGVSASEQLQKSSPKKIDIAQRIEEDSALGVDDRFARAMMRSKRSEGFVKEMSKSLSKSPLRKE